MDSNMQLNTSGVLIRDKNIDVDPVSDIIKRPLQEVIWDLVLTWALLIILKKHSNYSQCLTVI
jgi:hypothetical protein